MQSVSPPLALMLVASAEHALITYGMVDMEGGSSSVKSEGAEHEEREGKRQGGEVASGSNTSGEREGEGERERERAGCERPERECDSRDAEGKRQRCWPGWDRGNRICRSHQGCGLAGRLGQAPSYSFFHLSFFPFHFFFLVHQLFCSFLDLYGVTLPGLISA